MEDLFHARRLLDAMIVLPDSALVEHHLDLDLRFHYELATIGGNTVLAGIHRELLERLRPHFATLKWTHTRAKDTDAAHLHMYECVLAGDAQGAAAALNDHCNHAVLSLRAHIEKPPRRI